MYTKALGYTLLAGVFGSAIASVALIIWVWTRSVNPPDKVEKPYPTVPPTKTAQLISVVAPVIIAVSKPTSNEYWICA